MNKLLMILLTFTCANTMAAPNIDESWSITCNYSEEFGSPGEVLAMEPGPLDEDGNIEVHSSLNVDTYNPFITITRSSDNPNEAIFSGTYGVDIDNDGQIDSGKDAFLYDTKIVQFEEGFTDFGAIEVGNSYYHMYCRWPTANNSTN